MVVELSNFRVAVILPCYNEEAAIGQTVQEFRATIPEAVIYVYDNNSTDDTIACARAAGAVVRCEHRQGKGQVVRRMFADVEADIYVLADGDGTYAADHAGVLIRKLIDEGLDMVVGSRLTTYEGQAFRRGHRFGNDLLTGCLGLFFGRTFSDILSGYRVLSRRFVKSFPALSTGFETEIELTVHALELRMPSAEQVTPYRSRLEGSVSKLRTYRDGLRILKEILTLFREERPLPFFSIIASILALTAVILAIPVFITYLQTGLVPRFPTAILATGLMILSSLSLTCGLILETVTRGRREMKRLFYLSLPVLEKQGKG
ncbi:MAG: glycosyl transferase family protein [Desulfatitalea sp. BRH_c12]|nr:MAG: glycosyl transferase family protein [Desulfatitalea sp. BRH_c12]